MGIILWIIFGAIAGWVANNIMGTGDGFVTDVIVGIIGAFVGGYLMSMVGNAPVTGFNLYSLVVAVLGAVVLLWVVKLFKK